MTTTQCLIYIAAIVIYQLLFGRHDDDEEEKDRQIERDKIADTVRSKMKDQ